MGRLIDADELIIRLRNESIIPFSKMLLTDEHRWFIKLEDMIKTQPTAYDVEKVVAEFEREKELHTEHYNNSIYKDFPDVKQRYIQIQLVLDKAIEIVRKGGVE